MARNELADKLGLVGEMLEIEGMSDLFDKFNTKGLTMIQMNAIIIQIGSLTMKKNPDAADKLIAMNRKIPVEDVEKIDDGEYGKALRKAISEEVLGFLGSSPRTENKK